LPYAFRETDLDRLECRAQIAAVKEWIRREDLRLATPGLVLHGQLSGAGKTQLATWATLQIATEWWSGEKEQALSVKDGEGCVGLWFGVDTFRRRYGEVYRDYEARGEWQRELCECIVLSLDDIDKVKPSDGFLELLFAVLDTRLTSARRTILTTNLNGAALAQRWGDDYGPYLVRRLADYCVAVDFDVEVVANVVNLQEKTA
jgi:DNA replication protein DnaC